MIPVKLTIKIGSKTQTIAFEDTTFNLESQLHQFITKALQVIEVKGAAKEQLLVEIKSEPKINFDAPRPAPLSTPISNGMGDPFKGTSWGINK